MATKKRTSKEKRLRDADYVLVDGRAWFTVKQCSVHIRTTNDCVIVDIYALGHEMDDALASTYAFHQDAKNVIRGA